jgi:hypothetical protein
MYIYISTRECNMNTAPPETRIVQTAYVMWGGVLFLGGGGRRMLKGKDRTLLQIIKLVKHFDFR